MEKLFDTLLFNMMDLLLDSCAGCLMMEWLAEDMPEWATLEPAEERSMMNWN